jgi:hypothetical protein
MTDMRRTEDHVTLYQAARKARAEAMRSAIALAAGAIRKALRPAPGAGRAVPKLG